jgi:alkylhydroperoxidase family enzyme
MWKTENTMKTTFPIHRPETAPDASKPLLAQSKRAFGMIPNLIGEMAESPALIKGYLALAGAFGESSFSPLEQHVVLQTVNSVNACDYCTAAHSTAAIGVLKIDPAIDDALRKLRPLGDARLEALRTYTMKVAAMRGRVTDEDTGNFIAAGYTVAQVLEVVLGVGMKTISNYLNHIAATPVDTAFRAHRLDAAA